MTEQELIDFICKDKGLENNAIEIMFYSDFQKIKRKRQFRGMAFDERCVARLDTEEIHFLKKKGDKYANLKFVDKKKWIYFTYIHKWTLEELHEKVNGLERTMKTAKDDDGYIRSRHSYLYKGKQCWFFQ